MVYIKKPTNNTLYARVTNKILCTFVGRKEETQKLILDNNLDEMDKRRDLLDFSVVDVDCDLVGSERHYGYNLRVTGLDTQFYRILKRVLPDLPVDYSLALSTDTDARKVENSDESGMFTNIRSSSVHKSICSLSFIGFFNKDLTGLFEFLQWENWVSGYLSKCNTYAKYNKNKRQLKYMHTETDLTDADILQALSYIDDCFFEPTQQILDKNSDVLKLRYLDSARILRLLSCYINMFANWRKFRNNMLEKTIRRSQKGKAPNESILFGLHSVFIYFLQSKGENHVLAKNTYKEAVEEYQSLHPDLTRQVVSTTSVSDKAKNDRLSDSTMAFLDKRYKGGNTKKAKSGSYWNY